MNGAIFALTISVLCAVSGPSTETSLNGLVRQLESQAKMRSSLPTGASGSAPDAILLRVIPSLNAAIRSRDYNQIKGLLGSVAGSGELSSESRKIIEEMLGKVESAEKRQSEEDLKQMEKLLDEAGGSLLKADTPKDLDAPLSDVSIFLGVSRSDRSAEVQAMRRRLEAMKQMLENWQNLLGQIASGDANNAKSSARSAINSASTAAVPPRSELMARSEKLLAGISQEQSTRGKAEAPISDSWFPERLAKVQTLEDLAGVVRELNGRTRLTPYESNLRNDLQNLLRTWVSIEEGRISSSSFGNISSERYSPEVRRIGEIIRSDVGRWVVGEAETAEIKDGVDQAEAIFQAMKHAHAQQDWQTLSDLFTRVSTVYQVIGIEKFVPDWRKTMQAVQEMLIAERYRKNGDLAAAIEHYRVAAQSTSPLSAGEAAAKALRDLRREDGPAFQAAEEESILKQAAESASRMAVSSAMRDRLPFNRRPAGNAFTEELRKIIGEEMERMKMLEREKPPEKPEAPSSAPE